MSDVLAELERLRTAERIAAEVYFGDRTPETFDIWCRLESELHTVLAAYSSPLLAIAKAARDWLSIDDGDVDEPLLRLMAAVRSLDEVKL